MNESLYMDLLHSSVAEVCVYHLCGGRGREGGARVQTCLSVKFVYIYDLSPLRHAYPSPYFKQLIKITLYVTKIILTLQRLS